MAAPGQQKPPFPAPQDQDLKNIIDKLANFVARNGTKFEEMTKSKQKDNPKFSFLFGGEYFNYYKWKVSSEVAQGKILNPHLQSSFPSAQAAIVQQAIVQQSIQSAPWQQAQQSPAVVPVQQHQALPTQQQPQITQQPFTSQSDFNIQELESYLLKIMQSCTKDNISNGKNWIFKNCKTNDDFKQVADYMLLRVTGVGMGFLHKLHIIYLINDVLHHSTRKSTQDVRPVFEEVIVPIYCCTFVGESSEHQQRLEKVIRIWETNSYFDIETIKKMKNAEKTKEQLESSGGQDYTESSYNYEQYDENQYAPYDASYQQPTHNPNEVTDKTNKAMNENQDEKDQRQEMPSTEQKDVARDGDGSSTAGIPTEPPPIENFEPQPIPVTENRPFNQIPQHPHPDPNYPFPNPNFPYDHPPDFHQFPPPGFPRPPFSQPPPGFNGHMPPFDPNFARGPPPSMGYPHCPPQQFDYNHGFPDQPPSTVHDYHHGQPGGPVIEELPPPPQAMYYELPAGLMVPLVNSSDVEYAPLKQDDIQLPPPQPPSERLVNAVEAFYSPPSHERPKNSDGWEAGALHEFYKTKLPFIKQREIKEKVEKVKEMSMKSVDEKPDNRNRSHSRSKSRGRSKSISPRRRSRSRSPRRRSRTKSKSRSRSPRRRRSKSRSKSKSRSRSRSRSPRRRRSASPPPRRRSPTPPSFAGAYLQQSLNTRIDETNVGHKLLKKMGWEGAGLGKAEQGIQDPIKQGDIRDKQDMYKGIGIDLNDAFSQYRKNMSYTFNRPRKDRK